MRSAMHAASQLSGRGPTGVDVAPIHCTCTLIKNLIMIYDDDMMNGVRGQVKIHSSR